MSASGTVFVSGQLLKANRSVYEEAIALGFVDAETFDRVVRPEDMIGPM